jgi:hypothetical protein
LEPPVHELENRPPDGRTVLAAVAKALGRTRTETVAMILARLARSAQFSKNIAGRRPLGLKPLHNRGRLQGCEPPPVRRPHPSKNTDERKPLPKAFFRLAGLRILAFEKSQGKGLFVFYLL